MRGFIVAVLVEGVIASAIGAVLAPYGFGFVLICCGCLLGLAAILEPEFTE
jgi:hypothetical protein